MPLIVGLRAFLSFGISWMAFKYFFPRCYRKCCWWKTRNNGTPSYSPKWKTNNGKNILDGISILFPEVLPQVLLVENTQQRLANLEHQQRH